MRRPAIQRDHRQDQQTENELLSFAFQADPDPERGQDLQHQHADDREPIAAIAPPFSEVRR